MKRVAWSMLMVVGVSGLAAAGAGKIQWREGRHLDAALTESKTTGVPIMIYFSSEGCGACQALCSDALSDEGVVQASEKLIRVHADAGRDGKLFEKYGVKQIPALLFFSPDGVEVGTLTGRDANSLKRQFEEIAEKYTRGPRWIENADKALESGQSDGKLVVLVFVDGKAKSDQLLKSFGDVAYNDIFEKVVFAKVEFKKDSDESRKWNVTEAPTLRIVDSRRCCVKPAILKTVNGLKAPKDLMKDLENALRKFEKK